MPSSHAGDSIHWFGIDLLRGSYALTELTSELTDVLEQDPEFTDDSGEAVIEMVESSLRLQLEAESAADIDRARELLVVAIGGVVEQLEIALELRGVPGGTDAAEIVAGEPEPLSGPVGELADALVYCGALLSQVVVQMVQWDGGVPSGNVAIPAGATKLVGALLRDLDCFSEDEVIGATHLIEALSESLTTDVFFVEPDALGNDDEPG